MILSEFRNNVYQVMQDFDRTHHPGWVDSAVNHRIEKFCLETHILRTVQTVTITNGIGNIRPTPDSVGLSGRILRVEDANNNNEALFKARNASEMDVLYGKDWHAAVTPPMVCYLLGLAQEPASGSITGTQDAYSTITTYPLVGTGKVNIHYEGTPRRLLTDGDVCDVPPHLHWGICFGAAWWILSTEGDQSKAALIQALLGQWNEYVAQGKVEVGEWGGPSTTVK